VSADSRNLCNSCRGVYMIAGHTGPFCTACSVILRNQTEAAADARRERVRAAVEGVLDASDRVLPPWNELGDKLTAAAVEAMEREGGER
jgi:hypothetical protein